MNTNSRMDRFERAAHESIGYDKWALERLFIVAPAAAHIGAWLRSFKDFPPRQKPGTFNLNRVVEAVTSGK